MKSDLESKLDKHIEETSLPIKGYPTMLLYDSLGHLISDGQKTVDWAINKFVTREELQKIMQR